MKSNCGWTEYHHLYVNGCRCVVCVSSAAAGYLTFSSGMTACLCLFLTLNYEQQQSGTGGLLSLVVSEGHLCVVIDSRDGIRWAGVMCQAANPNHLTFKNWAATPEPCPITHLFSQRKNPAKAGRDPNTVGLWLMPDRCPDFHFYKGCNVVVYTQHFKQLRMPSILILNHTCINIKHTMSESYQEMVWNIIHVANPGLFSLNGNKEWLI